MKRLLIIGAGGFGREVLGWALNVETVQHEWKVGGFLDSNAAALKGYPCDLAIVGDPLTFAPSEEDTFVCAIGDPVTRLRMCRALKRRGASFTTLVHPTAVIGPACRLGEGCLLCPGAVLTTNVTLGDLVILNVYASVGHDVHIGDGCTLNAHSDVTGCAELAEGVLLGSHAVVLPNAKVGEFATVGAGSVVLRKVRSHTTVMGVPAREVFGFGEPILQGVPNGGGT